MDFWQKLINGTPFSPANNTRAHAADPTKRLAGFKRAYDSLLVSIDVVTARSRWSGEFQQVWRTSNTLAGDATTAETVRALIQQLTAILADESRRPNPHVCITFAAAKQIYTPIGKIATMSHNEAVIREAVALFSTLIESEEEDFVENDAFSSSLMSLLVRVTSANSILLSSETEVEVVELAFGIAAKIRLQPEILPAWFRAQEQAEEASLNEQEAFVGKAYKQDFPLFYLLIDKMHEDGRIGDFARTGLLYIIESASTSTALEQWIVESDLATRMSTGLGALYGRLSRKLVIDYLPEELPLVLAMSDYEHATATSDIVSSISEDFQGDISTFLSHLLFWQDVLAHCNSAEVRATLLEHFQVLFLQQILYPSLLESSDVDGGSSVAVLTYLRRILEALDNPDIIQMILQYLLALPQPMTPSRLTRSPANVSAARKRKSMDLQTIMAINPDVASTPSIFNLVDLILASLVSGSQQTVHVTLQLLATIIRQHHRYATQTLLRTIPTSSKRTRTIGAHEAELEFLMKLCDESNSGTLGEDIYEDHIQDSMALLESHPCSHSLVAAITSEGTVKDQCQQSAIPGAPRDVDYHALSNDDPVLTILFQLLDSFFLNPIELNLSLTETIIDLASCGRVDVSGWLLPDPAFYEYDDDDTSDSLTVSGLLRFPSQHSDPQLTSIAIARARRRPWFPPARMPTAFFTLSRLIKQLELYRQRIPRFNELLAARQHVLTTASSAPRTNSLRIYLDPESRARSSTKSSNKSRDSVHGSPAQNPVGEIRTALDNFAQKLFPDLSTSPSRSGSPRGRAGSRVAVERGSSSTQSTPTPLHRAGLNKELPPVPGSPQITLLGSPRLAPDNAGGMLRRSGGRGLSPSPLRADMISAVDESQARAFMDIEREILVRRVGLQKDTTIETANMAGSSEVAGADNATKDDDPPAIGAVEDEEERTVSVNHLLTNVVILQEFLLELAALVQVRAGLFGEVTFV